MTKYIMDCHAHIYPAKIARKAADAIGTFYETKSAGDGTAEGLVRIGETAGITHYLIHSVATTPAQVEHINDFLSSQRDVHENFVAFGSLHPYMDNVEKEIDRMIELGLRGIKMHPDFQHFYLDEPKAFELYKAVNGRLPILFHIGDERPEYTYSSPERLAKVLDAFPELKIIAAHFGGYSVWDEAQKYLYGRDIIFDTSSTMFRKSAAECKDLIHEHGADKFFFGTDYPLWNPKHELELFNTIELTQEERDLILFENAKKFFDLKV